MNIPKLKSKMVEKNISISKAAEKMSISKAALYRKLNKPENLTIREVQELKVVLRLTNSEAIDIFLK